MKKNERTESLGTRLKGYERDFETRIDAKSFIVCRIDGHKFSRYTKGMRKPFDKVLSKTMENTSKALMQEFGPSTIYTQSDEITLVFPPMYKEKLEVVQYKDIEVSYGKFNSDIEYRVFDKNNKNLGIVVADMEDGNNIEYTFYKEPIEPERNYDVVFDSCVMIGFSKVSKIEITKQVENKFSQYIIKKVVVINNQILGGRIQKMSSLIAGFTTMAFNKNFKKRLKKEFKQNGESIQDFIQYQDVMKQKNGNAWFDARVYGVPSKEEAYNSIMWRTRDCYKNAQSMFAQCWCSHKSLLNKTGPEQVEFCLEQTGNDFSKIKEKYKYGILIKREYYQKTVTPLASMSNQSPTIQRTRIVTFTDKRFTSFSEENVDLVIRKIK